MTLCELMNRLHSIRPDTALPQEWCDGGSSAQTGSVNRRSSTLGSIPIERAPTPEEKLDLVAACILDAADEFGKGGWDDAISRLVEAINPHPVSVAGGAHFQFSRPPAAQRLVKGGGDSEGEGQGGTAEEDGKGEEGDVEREESGGSLGKRGMRPEWEVDAVQVKQVS